MQSEGEMYASKLTSVAMALSLWCQGHVGQSDDKVYSASEKHIVADIFVYTLALTGKGHFVHAITAHALSLGIHTMHMTA